MVGFQKEWEEKLDIKITLSQETEPMGTAGPIALAKQLLDDGSGDPFFLLNSDVICDYPLRELLEFHKSRQAEGTILVTKVDDPSKYGVVVSDRDGKIDAFVEKPKEFVSDRINAGIYILSIDVIRRIHLRPTSIEREIFPAVATEGKLYSMLLPGHWMDVGQPKDYLKGLHLHLNSLRIHHPQDLASGEGYKGNVLIDTSAKIGQGCIIGPDVCIGENCIIGNGVRLMNCVIMKGVKVGNYAFCLDSIIGWSSTLGDWSRVENGTVMGKDVRIQSEISVNGGIILPHKEIKEAIREAKIVL
eukprot:g5562.t1